MELRQVAEKVKMDLIARYGYFTEDRPVVTFGIDLIGGIWTLDKRGETEASDEECENPYAVVSWECGPPQWSTGDTYWLHEEIAPLMQEFGVDPKYDSSKYKPYFDEVEGFYMEPVNSYQLAIRPN